MIKRLALNPPALHGLRHIPRLYAVATRIDLSNLFCFLPCSPWLTLTLST